MAYDQARLEQALINADKAGDTEAAAAFAAEIRKMRGITQEPEKPSNPTLGEFVFGDTTAGEYAKGRINAAKDVFKPETWKNIGSELANFPPLPDDLSSALREEPKPGSNFDPSGLAMSAMPVSSMANSVRSALLGPTEKAADIIKQQTLNAAGKAGYSVPRSNIKQSWLTNLGERFGGKQAIEATAQMSNQPITNKMAARALGLADETPITAELLKELRAEAGKSYDAIKGIGVLTADKSYSTSLKEIADKYSGASKDFPELANQSVGKLVKALNKKTISSEGALEQIKNLRDAAKSNLGPMASSADKLTGKAQKKAADALEDLIERNIEPTLGKQMLESFKTSRQAIAKTYTIEKALNPSTGNIVGTEIAKQAKKGVPLTGELKEIANFSRAFPRLSREPGGAPASGGLFEPMVYGTSGALATGGPGALAALIPIIGKPISRKFMTAVPKQSSAPVNQTLARMLLQRGALGTSASAQNNYLANLLNEQRNQNGQ